MKKLLFLFFLAVPVLLTGCGAKPQIQPVQNLTELQTEITRISDELLSGSIDSATAQILLTQLQAKYSELTEEQLLSRMDGLQKMIDQKKDAAVKLGQLPSWATNLWLTLPQRMRFNPVLSKHNEGYTSFSYVYKWPYAYSMKEAQRIASWANLFLSPEVAQAQKVLTEWTAVTGIDTQALTQGVVYTNHSLMDTNIDYLITVSVDVDGALAIEAVDYKQMEK